MSKNDRLANQVREYRKRGKIRQSDLAEQVGVTRQTIIAIEKGKFNPSMLVGLRIAQALGESVDTLFALAPLDAASATPVCAEAADCVLEETSAVVEEPTPAPPGAEAVIDEPAPWEPEDFVLPEEPLEEDTAEPVSGAAETPTDAPGTEPAPADFAQPEPIMPATAPKPSEEVPGQAAVAKPTEEPSTKPVQVFWDFS